MANNWYPIIDYSKCSRCLSCASFCPHGVFEIKDGKPVVSHPENCVEFCRGCQKGAGDFEAILYPLDLKKV